MSRVALRTTEEALRALSRFTNYERTRANGPRDFDLERPSGLLRRVGSPHLDLAPRVIQVAGTKGKGSTARFLDGILRAAGLKTGRFTSPHLEHVRERICVDGRPIAEGDFAARVEQVLAAVEGWTTFFESTLAAACLHFVDRGVDAVVLEVGLGGRLDATTAVPTTHNVITGIGLEHTEILGRTIEEVAGEKAATIRPGVPVWSGVDPDTPAGFVIRSVALEREAPFEYVPPPEDVVADGTGLNWNGVRLSVLGRHQARNAALAAAACADVAADAVRRGLAATRQPGCCELRDRTAPPALVDGAHTPESIAATVAAVRDHFPGARPALVLALAVDKDLDRIAAALAPLAGPVLATRADDRRGMEPERIAAHAAWRGRAVVEPEPAVALDRARAAAGPNGLVLVTGSLYLAGALRPLT